MGNGIFIRADAKATAKDQMRGNLPTLIVIELLYIAITGILAAIPVVGALAAVLISGPFAVAIIWIYLGVTRYEKPRVEDLFKGFFTVLVPSFMTMLLVYIFTMLWSLLLVVPGIIKGLSYSMSMYILAENPDVSAFDAINESKRIMDGHKMEMFVLGLSFIPWILLTSITFGIAGLYVIPYMQTTMANYYQYVRDSAGPVGD
ncbi:MAG: DUF975 family protein [Oscillospiraceae bacterium]|jgi:uncharacterized membrane protein|nr:DUF975 family protein [Oscillospiraceae bacterium]